MGRHSRHVFQDQGSPGNGGAVPETDTEIVCSGHIKGDVFEMSTPLNGHNIDVFRRQNGRDAIIMRSRWWFASLRSSDCRRVKRT